MSMMAAPASTPLNRHMADKTGSGMAVQVDRQIGRCTQRLDQFEGRLWRQQAGHILDGDRVGAHCFQGLGQIHEIGGIVHGLVV